MQDQVSKTQKLLPNASQVSSTNTSDLIILKNTFEKRRLFYYLLFIGLCIVNLIPQLAFVILLSTKYASLFTKKEKGIVTDYIIYISVMMAVMSGLLGYGVYIYRSAGEFQYLRPHEKVIQYGLIIFLLFNLIAPAGFTLVDINTEIPKFIATIKTIQNKTDNYFIRLILLYNFVMALLGIIFLIVAYYICSLMLVVLVARELHFLLLVRVSPSGGSLKQLSISSQNDTCAVKSQYRNAVSTIIEFVTNSIIVDTV